MFIQQNINTQEEKTQPTQTPQHIIHITYTEQDLALHNTKVLN